MRQEPRHDNACLAAQLRGARSHLEPGAALTPPPVPIPLTCAQLQALRADNPQAELVLVRLREPLAAAKLESALQQLVAMHDAFRLCFQREPDGTWSQGHVKFEELRRAWQHEPLLWTRDASDGAQLRAIYQAARASMRPDVGVVFRAVRISRPKAQQLMLVAHRAALDVVSWRTVLEDLERHCREADHQAPSGPAKPDATALLHAVQGLMELSHDRHLHDELTFWREGQRGAAEVRSENASEEETADSFKSIGLRLDRKRTAELTKALAGSGAGSMSDALLTALARVLCRWSGQASVRVALHADARHLSFAAPDTARIVGALTTTFPLRLSPELGTTSHALNRAIAEVHATRTSVPHAGVGYAVLTELLDSSGHAQLADTPARVSFHYDARPADPREDRLFVYDPDQVELRTAVHEHSELWLAVESWLAEGELSVLWTYAVDHYRRQTIVQLLDDFRCELEKLLPRSISKRRGGVTPSDFPLARMTQAQLDRLPVQARQIEDLYPLSPLQQGMLFHAIYEPESRIYTNQIRAELGTVVVERLQACWDRVVTRHAVLRTSFVWSADMGEPVQIVHRSTAAKLTVVDLRAHPDGAAACLELAAAERAGGFDWRKAPLHRLLLMRTASDRYTLLWTYHHILLDGWSLARLIDELFAEYAGAPPRTPVGRYRDYIAWLKQRDNRAAELFWKRELRALDGPTLLASAVPRPRGESGRGSSSCMLGAPLSARLRQAARELGVTPSVVVQGAILLLLQNYTGQPTVACGYTVSARPDEVADVQSTLGLFIQTVPMIQRPPPASTVTAWLKALHMHNVEVREHAHTPLYDIQRWGPARGQPIFDTLVVFDNYPTQRVGADSALECTKLEATGTTHYALTLGVHFTQSVEIKLDYARDQFTPETVGSISTHLRRLVEQLLENGERTVVELQMLHPTDLAEVCRYAGEGASTLQTPRSTHELFERQAAITPDSVAVVHGSDALTYCKLAELSARLARRLCELGVREGALVGVAVERSLEMVIALLGVLKAGAAYVPVDPSHPPERLEYVLSDSGVELVITQAEFASALPGLRVRTWCVDANWHELLDCAEYAPRRSPHSEQLAYCIYTSGSTGQPKGSPMTHAGMAQRMEWMRAHYAIAPSDIVLHKTPLTFDVSVWELFVPLISGAKLIVANPGDHREPERLTALLLAHSVTIVHFVPAMLRQFLTLDAITKCRTIRYVFSGGEALTYDLQSRLFEALPHAKLHNRYGPTETAIYVSHWPCLDEGDRPIPIGVPIPDVRLYVLDPWLRQVPVGVTGELFVAGCGLSPGYHGRPGLTAERFVPNPLSTRGERMYATGDRARYRTDGAIEYLGRNDHQVKIRGLRVELGEIEAKLALNASVGAAVVHVHESARGSELVAYVVPAQAGTVDDHAALVRALKQHLALHLPDHMVPRHIVLLPALPVTTSGKVDRRALPEPDQIRAEYLPPRLGIEQAVAQIWAEVLGTERVSRTENFFDLGGHSLLATQVVSRIRHELRLDVSLRQVFEARSLEHFVAALDIRTLDIYSPESCDRHETS